MSRLITGLMMFCALACIVATQAVSPQNKQQLKSPEPEEPTVIQEGALTGKQKEHAKLFNQNLPKLKDTKTPAKGDVNLVIEVEPGFQPAITEPQPPALQSALCNASAVVVGTLKNKKSLLTEDGGFIFTEHDLSVEEVIKNNTAYPIQNGESIMVVRAGGAVQMNGRTYRAERSDFKSPRKDNRYLFFLRFIPSTGTYLAYGNGSFLLAGESVIALGNDSGLAELLDGGSKNTTVFLNEVRSYSTSNCE